MNTIRIAVKVLRFAALATFSLFVVVAQAATTTGAVPSAGETRRAFVLGIKDYPDPEIQSLTLPKADAEGLASDLEQVGFDKKNITTSTNLRTKADFDKQFAAFVSTIYEGDVVLFFFSGHGVGVDASNTDYLLPGGIHSLFTYAHEKLPPVDRTNDDIVRLKMPTLAADYETDEIAKNGISVPDVIAQIGAKKPRIMILLLDACRSLATKKAVDEDIARGADSGSRLLPLSNLPPGAIIVFSASFGEAAIEKLSGENRKNSLFTEVVRSELQRPGQTLMELATRIQRVVTDFASKSGRQQEPAIYESLGSDERFALVNSIGAERFVLKQEKCEGSKEDWADIEQRPDRRAIERHQSRYHDCPTAELARRALVNLLASSQDPKPVDAQHSDRPIDDCDRLAASDADTSRPPGVAGLELKDIDWANAINACDETIKHNPHVVRFLHNLARAQVARATFDDSLDDYRRAALLKEARATYTDAATRGYVEAVFDLAVLFYSPEESDEQLAKDNKGLTSAASQQFGPAMYELALRYNLGMRGQARDIVSGYKWMIKAAERGYTPAMVGAANALFYGSGVTPRNPRRGAEWAVRAANAGSTEAKLLLGDFYFGSQGWVWNSQTNEKSTNSLDRDYTQALLWWGRAAEDGSAIAEYNLGYMMERGLGLPAPQPEVAERYYRLAALGGDEDAEYELARRLRVGTLLAKPEHGDAEAIDLLRRAFSHGSARAAQALAEVYRNGELGVGKDPARAVQYAFQAIRLSTEADPTTPDGDPYHEMAAGIMLAEMAYNNLTVDADGHALFKPEEVARMQTFYGRVDPQTRSVKVRSFEVPLNCIDPKIWKTRLWTDKQLWIWDWGRNEAPTEPQFRSLERSTTCQFNDVLRQTLVMAYDTSKKNKVPYADLVEQEVLAARAREDGVARKKK